MLRYYLEMKENPKAYLKKVKIEDIKIFFDWVIENHRDTIKEDSSLDYY